MLLSRICIRACPGHPVFMKVSMFSRDNKYLMMPYKVSDTDIKNVLVTSCNPLVSKYLQQEYNCTVEEFPITIPKHVSEIIQADLVNIIGMSCDRITAEIEWECQYYVPPAMSIQSARKILHFME